MSKWRLRDRSVRAEVAVLKADRLHLLIPRESERSCRLEIWDSREQLDAFGKRLMPVLVAEVAIEPGEPEVLEIHSIVRR